MKIFPQKNLWTGNFAKSMMSESNSVLLPANVDAHEIYFHEFVHLKAFPGKLYNKSLSDSRETN